MRLPSVVRLTALAVALAPAVLRGEDWPRWRGPRGDGISADAGAPVHIGPKENLLWRVEPPGSGHSSPIVVGDAIFLTAAAPLGGAGAPEKKGQEARRVLLRLDRRDGKLVWEREIVRSPLEGKHPKNSCASGTPASDGKLVYLAFLGEGKVQAAAVTLDGRIAWRAAPCGFKSVHGFSTTPVLFEDLVILNCDQDSEEASICALDRETGAVRWRTERENHLRSYVPPHIFEHGGRTQMVLAGSKCISSYDPRSGKRLWVCDGPTEQCVATAVYGNGLVIITGGFPDREVMAIRPDGEGDVTSSHVAWRAKKGVSYVPSPILLGERFYVVHDETGVLAAYEARTGRLLFQERLGGAFSSSMVAAGGNIYLGSEDGDLHVFAAGPRFERKAEAQFGEGIFATPAFSDGKIYLRTVKALYAFGDKRRPSTGDRQQ
jgi:outer membrane protein assembly factor BamB